MSDDPKRAHLNNLSHAREVYLSTLRIVPTEMLVQEMFLLLGSVKSMCQPAADSDVRRRMDDAQWAFMNEGF